MVTSGTVVVLSPQSAEGIKAPKQGLKAYSQGPGASVRNGESTLLKTLCYCLGYNFDIMTRSAFGSALTCAKCEWKRARSQPRIAGREKIPILLHSASKKYRRGVFLSLANRWQFPQKLHSTSAKPRAYVLGVISVLRTSPDLYRIYSI